MVEVGAVRVSPHFAVVQCIYTSIEIQANLRKKGQRLPPFIGYHLLFNHLTRGCCSPPEYANYSTHIIALDL